MAAISTTMQQGRSQAYARLVRRNRLVDVLRVAVPAVGAVIFVGLAVQIYVANVARQYGISGIRIDRDGIAFDTPRYSGMSADGSHYIVTALEARSPAGESDLIRMTDPVLTYAVNAGTTYTLNAPGADFFNRSGKIDVAGVTQVTSDDGLVGTLTGLKSDMNADVTTADGPVDITLGDGTKIVADSMLHEGKLQRWTFTRATVVFIGLPEAEE